MFTWFVIIYCLAGVTYGIIMLFLDGKELMLRRPTSPRYSECWFQDEDGRIYYDEEGLLDG
jgi:hypothetical protein